MKRKLLLWGLISVLMLQASVASAQSTKVFWNGHKIPNPQLRSYILEKYDTDKNGVMSKQEAAAVDSISLELTIYDEDRNSVETGSDEASLKGIEFFPNLTYLYYWVNALTSLDVSKNKALKYLNVNNSFDGYTGFITTLKLPKNSLLEELYCEGNLLTSLDVSRSPNLRVLECGGNKLTALDLSRNPALVELDCSGNQIWSLHVGDNPSLKSLACSGNQISALNVGNNPSLKSLACQDNQISWLNLSKNNKGIVMFCCSNNPLRSLDISILSRLTHLDFGSSTLRSLDLSHLSELKALYCSYLTKLDLSKNTALQSLWMENCTLDKLDLSNNYELTFLDCSSESNKIGLFDLSNIKNLEVADLTKGSSVIMTDDEYNWSGRAANLKSWWRELMREKRQAAEEKRQKAQAAEQQRQEQLAQEKLANAPKLAEYKRLAVQAAQRGNWEEANNMALKADNEDAYIHLIRAKALYHRELQLDVDSDSDVSTYFRAYRSEAQRLLAICNNSIALDSSHDNEAYFYRGIANIVLGKAYYSDAVSDFTQYMKGYPQARDIAYYNIGVAYKNADYYRDALDAFKSAHMYAQDEQLKKSILSKIKSCQEKIDGR